VKPHARPSTAVRLCVVAILIGFVCFSALARAQGFEVIHDFTGGRDGGDPFAGLTMDRFGNLYGATFSGGSGHCGAGCGTVFRLTRSGENPEHLLTIAPDGTLYGTTVNGGGSGCAGQGCGTVYRLKPPVTIACATISCPWTETILYRFNGLDGAYPYGRVALDAAGNVYGTGSAGGAHGEGVLFRLTPAGGQWAETTLYTFGAPNDGLEPIAGPILDSAGNLYGTTSYGGTHNRGTVYEISPSGSGWSESILTNFERGESNPDGELVFDSAGNLFGTTYLGGAFFSGTVFELQPKNGGWQETVLHEFSGDGGPNGAVLIDSAGNLYGTSETTEGRGVVFKLTAMGNGWNYSELHAFNGDDGSFAEGEVTMDSNGNLYGTTAFGGSFGFGVIWQVTP